MIVVDASALVAIVSGEPEAELFLRAMTDAEAALLAAPTRLEAFIVMHRRYGERASDAMERLIGQLGLVTIPFDEAQLLQSLDAFRVWGRGRGKANLNFGDCFSYALAKSRRLPLLYKGSDFLTTDVEPAV